MTSIVVFLAAIGALGAWWLSGQGLMSRPWLHVGASDTSPSLAHIPAAKIGLGVFLAVVGSLFALFLSAYSMRSGLADWRTVPVPGLLWINTAVLIGGSAALHFASAAARRGHEERMLDALLAGQGAGYGFLGGQLLAWAELVRAGYGLAGNPASSFFYALTGLHGLHIVGGLAALAYVTAKAWGAEDTRSVRLSVELCAVYWHFLLFIWLVLFAALMGWAGEFIEMCRQVLS